MFRTKIEVLRRHYKMQKKLQKQQICLRLQGIDRSQKAYIYQQLVDFEFFLTPQSALVIEHCRLTDKEKKNHKVCITLMEGNTALKSEAEGCHLFDAIQNAKKQLMSHLQKMQENVINSKERNFQIHNILLSSGTLH